jgi:hypothetical protein
MTAYAGPRRHEGAPRDEGRAVTNACTNRGGRGCPCAYHARRRVYATNYARRQREKALDAKRMSARTCPRRFGRSGTCGAVLRSDIEGGVLVVSCPACERFARGICRDCPARVDGQVRKARRCKACKARALRDFTRKYATNNRELVNERARASYRDESVRERRNAYKRAWRAANPEKVKAQKQRETARHSERLAAYHAEYRQKHRTRIRNAQRARSAGAQRLRTCIACRRVVVTHKKRKCSKCKESSRQMALAILASRRRPSRAA